MAKHRKCILFYVSSHGYGHAARTAEVIIALHGLREPDLDIHVRTQAPRFLFPPGMQYHNASIDSGIRETPDALHIDAPGSILQLETLLARQDQILEQEAAFVRSHHIDLIVADIPFLAGDVAVRTGIDCVGISNFTWNWIFGPFLKASPNGESMLAAIKRGYRNMRELWQLPFSQKEDLDMFAEIRPFPLITKKTKLDGNTVRTRLVLPADDSRPVVFLGGRGHIAPDMIRAAASDAPDFLFLVLDPAAADGLDNVVPITLDALNFRDVLSISDAVVSKLGYGTVSECVVSKKRMLYPRREGFREDAITETEAARYTCLREIPIADFEAGHWNEHLRRLLADPLPPDEMPSNGAQLCAEALSQRLS